MAQTPQTRLDEYLLDSPSNSRFSEEKFILFLERITAVFDGFKALDVEALGIEHNELRVVIGRMVQEKQPCVILLAEKRNLLMERFILGGKTLRAYPRLRSP